MLSESQDSNPENQCGEKKSGRKMSHIVILSSHTRNSNTWVLVEENSFNIAEYKEVV